jgi:hypothetical protein
MALLKIRVVEQGGGLMPVGLHTAKVTSTRVTESSAGTPQLEVQFRSERTGLVRNAWYNLRGYKRNAKGDLVDKNGKKISLDGLEGDALIKALRRRVEDPEVTKKCENILGKFAFHLGFGKDEEITEDAMIDRECLVAVGNDGVSEKVIYTFSKDNVDGAERMTSNRLGFDVMLDEDVDEDEPVIV